MDFYIGLLQVIGVHTLLGLSAWCILHTGQVSLAQGGFFAIGAYVAGMLTAMAGWPLGLALLTAALIASLIAIAIGFPALRVKGLMLVVATTAFAEIVRLVFFNLKWQVQTPNGPVGPDGGLGFGGIRYFPANAWSGLEILALIWSLVAAVMLALWMLDRSRIGTLWRAVGEDEEAAARTDMRQPHLLPLALQLHQVGKAADLIEQARRLDLVEPAALHDHPARADPWLNTDLRHLTGLAAELAQHLVGAQSSLQVLGRGVVREPVIRPVVLELL